MAKQLTIKAKLRESKTPNTLRREGFIPATIYGHGFQSQSVQLCAKDFSKIPHKAYSHINELDVDGKEKFPVLIRNVQVDPVRDNYLNVEFYRIKSDEKIKVKVPLNYIGHSPAVIAGGVLIVSYNEIEIQCLPNDIPDSVEVDLGQILEIGQSLHSKDLKVNQNIQILTRPEEVLAKVEIAKTHEIEEKPAVVAEGTEAVAAVAPAEAAAPAAGKAAAVPPASKAAAGKDAGPAKAPDTKTKK